MQEDIYLKDRYMILLLAPIMMILCFSPLPVSQVTLVIIRLRLARRAVMEGAAEISMANVNCLSLSENFVFPWRALYPLTEEWQSSWELWQPLFLSLFHTQTDRSQILNNRAYFNTFSVDTQAWLKINNLSIASFVPLESLFFLTLLCCCHSRYSALFGGIFFFFSFFSFSLFSGEAGMLSWVQSVIQHRTALSVSLYKQLWSLFLLSLVSLAKWLLERT